MSKAILWYRNDLRVHDHEPLHALLNAHEECVPVYVFDERQFASLGYGFSKTGAFRTKFLLESVSALKVKLRSLGSDLIIRFGKPETILPAMAAQLDVATVYASHEYGSEEWMVEQALAEALKNIELHLFHTAALIHPDDLPFELSSLPDIFTSFRKKVEKYAEVRPAFPTPKKLPALNSSLDLGALPSFEELDLVEPKMDDRTVLNFHGGEKVGLERLNHYLWISEAIATYKETRNGLIGADYSSKFSAFLANGSLSAKMIYHEVLRFEKQVKKNQSTYWMVFELLWRDYFKYVMMKFQERLFYRDGIKSLQNKPVIEMHRNERAFEHWASGNTGEAFVDANMRELNATGFMSNRGRQNVASYLVKDLKVDWRMGAAYFESMLIDYDVCSNYGNWQYVAGVGNDPREDRYFNVKKQAERYDPDGAYVALWKQPVHG